MYIYTYIYIGDILLLGTSLGAHAIACCYKVLVTEVQASIVLHSFGRVASAAASLPGSHQPACQLGSG